MQYEEKVRITRCVNDAGEKFGMIRLQHLAKKSTVVVEFCGERLYPEKFNIYGWPIFPKETCDLFDWKQRSLRRSKGEDFYLKAVVTYEKGDTDVDLYAIDTLEGLTERIEHDSWYLNTAIEFREIYCKGTGEKLNEFVVFGRYYLNEYGWVMILEKESEKVKVPLVCTKKQFDELYENEDVTWTDNSNIPDEGESCPWCTKKFSANDLKNGRFGKINGKISHLECMKQYEHEREIDRIINDIMEHVYPNGLTFELLPNGYCNHSCCSHKPWFLCHTPDGDIKIGWRKRVISITWEENFKQFDMSIFDDQYVSKWNRGIHAYGTGPAISYLRKVKDLVNPEPYSEN